ncbi:hypothetical protein K438DRAFT_1573997 [Mycena galopus ATCC 62051]|nr:hypothetical protein K438DRAFT_1573997 [Mycena galopus ATCC 62051]
MTFTSFPLNAKDDEPITECFFFAGSKEVVMNVPGFPQPLIHPPTLAFRVATVPGKGMGVFSTRALKMGDLILCERPLLISARGVPTSATPDATPEMLYTQTLDKLEECCTFAVSRMRPENRAAYMSLANSHTKDGSGPCVGIMRTNALSIRGLLPSNTTLASNVYCATCKDISRLNHSCSPNTCTYFDLPSFSFRLYAVRDIPAGEELTYPYLNVELPSVERNKELKPYGFVCTCSACTDPVSDARRATFAASAPNVLLWATVNRSLPEGWIFKKALQQLVLLTTEGMQHHIRYADATRAMMEAYICLGDADNASKWAAKVHKQVWAEKYQLADVEALLDPENTAAYEAHPFWRMRVDTPGPSAAAQMLQNVAALSSPKNMKALADGWTMMTFPSK